MSKDNVVSIRSPEGIEDPLTELLRSGAKRLIQKAVEAELAELLERYEGQVDEQGRKAVVRNGYLPEREILTGVGPVPVKVPKVRSRTGEPVVFRSSLVPPYVRKARRVEAALPWLYLKGIATGQMQEALEVLVGPEAKGLSAGVISRLNTDDEPDRVYLCHGSSSDGPNQGMCKPEHHAGDDLQAGNECREALAQDPRIPLSCQAHKGCEVHRWS